MAHGLLSYWFVIGQAKTHETPLEDLNETAVLTFGALQVFLQASLHPYLYYCYLRLKWEYFEFRGVSARRS